MNDFFEDAGKVEAQCGRRVQGTVSTYWNALPFMTDKQLDDALAVQRLLKGLETEKSESEIFIN